MCHFGKTQIHFSLVAYSSTWNLGLIVLPPKFGYIKWNINSLFVLYHNANPWAQFRTSESMLVREALEFTFGLNCPISLSVFWRLVFDSVPILFFPLKASYFKNVKDICNFTWKYWKSTLDGIPNICEWKPTFVVMSEYIIMMDPIVRAEPGTASRFPVCVVAAQAVESCSSTFPGASAESLRGRIGTRIGAPIEPQDRSLCMLADLI